MFETLSYREDFGFNVYPLEIAAIQAIPVSNGFSY